MDLVEFFKQKFKVEDDKYYSDFFKGYFIRNMNTLNYEAIDEDDLIQDWKSKLYPSNSTSEESEAEFKLLSFWLYKNGFGVEDHPNILEKIISRGETSNGELYNATKRKFGATPTGAVTWSNRRKYIDELKIERVDKSVVVLERSLEEIMSHVSPRNAEFEKMEFNEKLANIRDVFEHIGKQNGNYLKIPFDTLSSGYITIQAVLIFQKELQCFRHGESEMVEKRSEYSEEQKRFFVDFGLTILMLAYRFLNKPSN